MDQHYKSAAAKLEKILTLHKQGLSKDETTSLTTLIKELKDVVPRKIDVERKFKVLENELERKHPDIWIQIKEIQNILGTDLTGTVRAEASTAASEPKASEMRQLKLENQYLKIILENLHRNIIVGEATSHKELKPPEDLMSNQTLMELSTKTQKVTHKFYEVETELDYVHRRISHLSSMMFELEGSEVQIQSPEKTNTFTAMGRKPRSNPAQATPQTERSLNLDKNLELLSSALTEMKEKESYLEGASKIIQELYIQAMEVNDDHEQEKPDTLTTTITMKGTEDTGHTDPKKTEPDIAKELERKGMAVAAALKKMKDVKGNTWHEMKIYKQDCNLKEMTETQTTTGFKQVVVDTRSTVPKNTEPSMTPKREKRANAVLATSTKTIDTTSGSNKETQETEHTVPTKIEPDIAHELEMKARAVSAALLQMKDANGRVKTLKNENEFLMQLLDALHESVIGVEQKTGKNKSSATPGNEPSKHDMASKILRSFQEKKSEAEYAACLLEELSRFSHATNKDDNGNILSLPQNVKASEDFKEKDAKNVDESQHKPQHCVHDENLMKYYKHASHVLKEMKESRGLRIDLGTKTGQLEILRTKLKSIQDENTKLMNEVDSLRTRLSEHAGALLNHDNPAIADLSDPNRATKLGEKYLELYDNQWTDAFSKLQIEYSSASDEELTGHLYKILVDGYVFCKDARQAQIFNLQEIMFNPTGDMTKTQRRPKEEVSKSLSNILSDAAKLSSNVTSGNIAKAFVKNEGTKNKYGKMIKLCETYIQECVQLCWYMQVQTPPLCLDRNTAKGHTFDKNSYKEYTTRGKKIAFVVWPALFLHENGPLLSKGVAQGDSARKQAADD